MPVEDRRLSSCLAESAAAAHKIGYCASRSLIIAVIAFDFASTEQAASLEESSSALEQLGGQARNNADEANKANDLMAEAKRIVDDTEYVRHACGDSRREDNPARAR